MTPLKWRNFTVLLALAAVLLLPMAANATMVPVPLDGAGTATNTLISPSGVYATDGWSNGFSITSAVTRFVDNQGFYVYEYDYLATVPTKEFSHIIFGVSAGAPSTNFWQGTVNDHTTPLVTANYSPSDPGNSNPGLPAAFWGIKFDDLSGTNVEFSFFSYNAPVWQDFYAKDGTSGGSDVYAYNTGFGQTITPYDTNYIIGPDSVGGKVPIPPSVLLMGSGLLGMGILSWRKKKE